MKWLRPVFVGMTLTDLAEQLSEDGCLRPSLTVAELERLKAWVPPPGHPVAETPAGRWTCGTRDGSVPQQRPPTCRVDQGQGPQDRVGLGVPKQIAGSPGRGDPNP